MKKILIPTLLCMCCILLCSCTNEKTQYYEQRISSYEEIAIYALENYANPDGSRVCVLLSDISDKSLSERILIAEEKFTYIWIENNSVIFWDDEMKTEGLVYSENPKRCIKDIQEWHNGQESKKISKNLYLIGHTI